MQIFFVVEKGKKGKKGSEEEGGTSKLKNRNEIYYSVFSDDEPRVFQVIKTCLFLDTILAIVQEIKKDHYTHSSFIIASLLDDIRYKFILLFEDVLSHEVDVDIENIEELASQAISNFYTYLLGTPLLTVGHAQLMLFAKKAREFITVYLEKFESTLGPLRKYKEADIPSDNLLFVQKLKENLPAEEIDIIIGIRFGGIELPYLVRHFIYPNAKIKLWKISNYSDNDEEILKKTEEFVEQNKGDFKNKNILIVDDSITTGRTAKILITALKNKSRNIYFSCVYYSQYKRIDHMRMEGHGGVDLEQLEKCCVLKETNYTASVNKKSYLGRNQKFDLTKEEIKERLADNPLKIEFPVEPQNVKEQNTKKVFYACSLSMITVSYDALLYIRNHFEKNPEYTIVDDWIVKRMHYDNGSNVYKEEIGRNFLYEAIEDIRQSDLIILFYPAPSTYLYSLFLVSALNNKEIWMYYRQKSDIKTFESYGNIKFIQIKNLKNSLI